MVEIDGSTLFAGILLKILWSNFLREHFMVEIYGSTLFAGVLLNFLLSNIFTGIVMVQLYGSTCQLVPPAPP